MDQNVSTSNANGSSKYGSIIDILECSWINAVTGFWKKYPNQYSQHVLTEDILERKVFPDGKLYTRRLLSKTNPLPQWGVVVFKSHLKQVAHVIEESIVDPAKHVMTVYTWNTTYAHMMEVHERLTITPADITKTTQVFREGWVNSSLTGFRHVLRQFGLTRWKSNARKAFLGYQSVLVQPTTHIGQHTVLGEKALDSLHEVKDKAKKKAIDLAVRANSPSVQS